MLLVMGLVVDGLGRKANSNIQDIRLVARVVVLEKNVKVVVVQLLGQDTARATTMCITRKTAVVVLVLLTILLMAAAGVFRWQANTNGYERNLSIPLRIKTTTTTPSIRILSSSPPLLLLEALILRFRCDTIGGRVGAAKHVRMLIDDDWFL
jgi:uncharacterized membrane protein YidH (DUF202 family)